MSALIIASTAIAAVGGGLSTASAMQQQTYQARVADRNAKLEGIAANDANQRGKIEAQRYQRQLAGQQGIQRAAMAANGIDPGFGSAADVQADLAIAGQQDLATIYDNAGREVRGLDISASNYTASGRAARQARTGTLIKGVTDFGTTIAGGAQQYRKYKTPTPATNSYGVSSFGGNIY